MPQKRKAEPERILLTEQQVVAFTGLSIHSLRSARSNKPNLRMPPHEYVEGRVFYDADRLLDWVIAKASRPGGSGSG